MINLIRYLIIFCISIACAGINRKIANFEESIAVEHEAGTCLVGSNLQTLSLYYDLYLVDSYDDKYYYLSKYTPENKLLDLADESNYQDPEIVWSKNGELSMTLNYVHFKLGSIKCPVNI